MSRVSETIDDYGIPSKILDDDKLIKTDNPIDDDEIMLLVNIAYNMADEISPTGKRTPNDIDKIERLKTQLEYELAERQREEEQDRAHRSAWQDWAEKQRQKIDQSLKTEKSEKIKRLQRALENSEVEVLLLKVMNKTLTREQAFAAIISNPGLRKQMLGLTLKGTGTGTGTRNGGKSRVFRRKNKKTRSKSRRNVRRTQRTRRHRKSSTRRSTRK
jgi:hypothetical protein